MATEIESLLEYTLNVGASELVVTEGASSAVRLAGKVCAIPDAPAVEPGALRNFLGSMEGESGTLMGGPWCGSRFRVRYNRTALGNSATFRPVLDECPDFSALGAPPALANVLGFRSGLVVFARTSKALSRLNKMFAEGEVHKTYWAIVKRKEEGGKRKENSEEWQRLEHWLVRNEKQNKSYAYNQEKPNAKKAILKYRVLSHSDNYSLLEVNLMTGRHHQIRCQLAAMGCPIKGDLKYGAPRSNPDGSISLMSRRVEFVHPVSKETIIVEAPLPDDTLWQALNDGRRKMEDV